MTLETLSPGTGLRASTPPLTLQVEYVDPGTIKPDARNARSHPKSQLDQLQKSITAFGFTNPIIVDEDGVIIAGHGRLMAAKRLALVSVPIIRLAHLSDLEKRALRLADNKIALNSGWDSALLKIELAAVTEIDAGIDLDALGFSIGEMDIQLSIPGQTDLDELPAVRATSTTQAGDIYVLGTHRIGCGDCRDLAFVERVMGWGMAADAAFLDLPYNVSITGHANVDSDHPEFAMASGEMTTPEFETFLGEALGICAKVSRNGAVHFVCMDWRSGALVEAVGGRIYDKLLNLCIWNKSNGGMGSLYRSKHELIYVFRVGDAQHINNVELGKHGRNRSNVWDYPSVNTFDRTRREELKGHPTAKPVALVADAIQDVTKRGDIVYDGCLGSGTTLIAAERTGRRFRGVEIDPVYIDLAVQRWVDMTGGVAKLERATRAQATDGR